MKSKIKVMLIFVFIIILNTTYIAYAQNQNYITLSDLVDESNSLEYKVIPYNYSENMQFSSLYGLDDYGMTIHNQSYTEEMENKEYIVISYTGEVDVYKDVIEYNNNFAIYDSDTPLFGVVNKEYRWVLPPIYDRVAFYGDYIIATKYGCIYIYNLSGELKTTIDDISYFQIYDKYLKIYLKNNMCCLYDKNINMVLSYELNSFERDSGFYEISDEVRSEFYYRGSYETGDKVVTGFSISDGKLGEINLSELVGKDFVADYSCILSSGELLIKGYKRNPMIYDPILILYSADSGEVKVDKQHLEDTVLGVYAYDIDEYIIFCEGTVFDKELNYIGRLYNDKLVEIYCEDEKLACITYEKEYNEREYFFDGEICNVSNEVYLLYDKKSNLDGNSYKIEKSELDCVPYRKLLAAKLNGQRNYKEWIY